MRENRNPYPNDRRNQNSNYIPNDDIDREEKADIRQQKKGSVFGVIMGGIIILTLLAFVFVLMDSGFLSSGAHPIYGSPDTKEESGNGAPAGELTQEEKKKAEEEARLAMEEEKKKEREEQAAREAEEEARKQAEKEEEEAQAAREAEKRKEERQKREAEEKEKQEEMRKQLEEEQEVLSGDYILPESSTRVYSESELEALTDKEVIFALNEIYAKKGRIFTGEEFKSYFESKSWYKGTIPAEEFDANQNDRFNDVEKANIAALVKIAQERGLR